MLPATRARSATPAAWLALYLLLATAIAFTSSFSAQGVAPLPASHRAVLMAYALPATDQVPRRSAFSARTSAQRTAPHPKLAQLHGQSPIHAHHVVSRPASRRDQLVGPGLDVAVTVYGDCTGRTPLTRAAVAIDACIGWDVYFLGHNPGLFTPIMGWGPGTIVTWYDNAGIAHPFRVGGYVTVPGGIAPRPPAGTAAQFQTCAVPSGAVIRVLYAIAA